MSRPAGAVDGALWTALLAEVERMLRESGDPARIAEVRPAQWLAQWLEAPLPALSGETPAEHAATPEGAARIVGLLASLQSGAYW